ncbi:MAG: hypothetical protein H0X54_01025 [Propionibacteriales bacterium]|jgi:hypothetical protein|nr:hypothetical protein [Propionibacteriales bacterium]
MVDNRRATVLVATPLAASAKLTGCNTCSLLRPVRWAVMKPSTSVARTSAGAFATTVKNTFRS